MPRSTPATPAAPLVDRLGRLVGINTAGVRLAEAENVSFAIAIDEALPVIARIRNQTPETTTWFGVAFNSVDSDSAAVQLGLDARSGAPRSPSSIRAGRARTPTWRSAT